MRRRRAAGRWWPTISSPPTRAPGWCRPPPPTAPRTWRSGAATAPRCCTRSTRRATSARRPAGCPACTSRPPTRRSSRTCAAAACWGTPLPLWRCDDGHVTAVESLADLSARAGRDLSGLDPHRPFVDEVAFACPECGQQARRVPDVIDAWFDSGSMPFAQWGYPHQEASADKFRGAFPADFISEAIDQTRGWFYSLLAASTMLFDRTPYRNVVCLGLIVDEDGRKMSKSLGNALDPFELLDTYGADPLRWFMLAGGSPWVARRLGPKALEEVTRSFFLTLWNTYAFFTLYARLEGFQPGSVPESQRTPLDRWVLARLAETVAGATTDLDAYDATGGARRLAAFVDDLSNWYVRLSRRRFWRGGDEGGQAAFDTLWRCLSTLSLLLAPYAPFLAEELWQG